MHAFVRKTTFMPQSCQRAALVDADNGYVASTARLPGSAGHVSPPAPRGFGIAGPPFSLRPQAALGRPSFLYEALAALGRPFFLYEALRESPAISANLLRARLVVVFGIRPHIDRRGHAVRHVEE